MDSEEVPTGHRGEIRLGYHVRGGRDSDRGVGRNVMYAGVLSPSNPSHPGANNTLAANDKCKQN